MKKINIPFNRVDVQGKELEYINESILNAHISGDGKFTQKCNSILESELGVRKSLLTTSCTHALEMTAMLIDIKPGDEVIMPTFTFVSTVNAFILRGAKPVFVDSRPDTLNIDETKIEKLINDKTKAIVVVHYAGVSCEMDVIIDIVKKYKLILIEDNAHGLFGKYKNNFLGTFGTFATQSFHETKNFSCGEGGSLIINDIKYIERAEIIREKGTNRSQFFRGQVDKYSWVDIGSSFLPSEILAAFLFAQLENYNVIQSKRKTIWDIYYNSFKELAGKKLFRLPIIPRACSQSYHLFYILMPSLEARTDLISFLKKCGISAVFHYVPLHLSKMGKKFGWGKGDCPIAEDLSERLVRLPLYNSLSIDYQKKIINHVENFCEGI